MIAVLSVISSPKNVVGNPKSRTRYSGIAPSGWKKTSATAKSAKTKYTRRGSASAERCGCGSTSAGAACRVAGARHVVIASTAKATSDVAASTTNSQRNDNVA